MNSSQRNRNNQQFSSRMLFLESELEYLKQEIKEKKNVLYFDQEMNQVISKMKQESNEMYYNDQNSCQKN